MEHQAKARGDIGDTRFLKISPRVLDIEGVMCCRTVANRADAVIYPLSEVESVLDLDILFGWHDLKDSEIRDRFNSTKRSEILVPHCVPVEFIMGL